MHDGRTRKVDIEEVERRQPFLVTHHVSLTLLNGQDAGREWALEGARTIVGRSEKAGLQLEDASVSNEHAAFEIGADGLGVRDLASTNGVLVNGNAIVSVGLSHGDRIRLGDCELQVVVEEKAGSPRVWSVEEGD